jgi:hypothetical protein
MSISLIFQDVVYLVGRKTVMKSVLMSVSRLMPSTSVLILSFLLTPYQFLSWHQKLRLRKWLVPAKLLKLVENAISAR